MGALSLGASLQAKCAALQLDDRSRYTVLPPRVWGLIPRLASRMRIEQVKAIFNRDAGQGFMLSLELHDCEATGFQNEPGNFICRSAVHRHGYANDDICMQGLERTVS